MVISMGMADKDDLDIPQNFPDIVGFVGIRPEESAHLTPRCLTGFKEDTSLVRNTDQVSRH